MSNLNKDSSTDINNLVNSKVDKDFENLQCNLNSADEEQKQDHKTPNEKFEFFKNWLENSNFDNTEQSSIADSSVYTSSVDGTESEYSDIINNIDGIKIEDKIRHSGTTTTTTGSSKSISTASSIIPSTDNDKRPQQQNNHIDIIHQIFRGDSSVQSFADINVQNSNRVHIGNITIFKGPIHIVHTDGGHVGTLNQKTTTNESTPTTKFNDTTTTTYNSSSSSNNSEPPNAANLREDEKYQKKNNSDENDEVVESNTEDYFIGKINQAIDGRVLKIIDRRTWLAQPPLSIELLKVPVSYVIISHTATEMTKTQAETVYMVRNIQTYHIESRNWHDIAYSFLIGCDGNVYEGRGWNRVGAHTAGYNKRAIGISFVGCFISSLPPDISLNACKLLIEKGISDGYILPDYKLLAHCQCSPTQSPGRRLFEELQSWQNWTAL